MSADATKEAGTTQRSSNRKVRTGIVSSDKMDKTIVIEIKMRKKHPLYGKTIPATKKIYAHDPENQAEEGDLVEVMETRPLSKTKCWRLIKILEKKK